MEAAAPWDLKNVSPDGAYQLGLMVANMIKVALDEAVEEASTKNIEAFRKGISEGLQKMGFDLNELEPFSVGETVKKRVTAYKNNGVYSS